MRGVKRLIIAVILATTLFLNACANKDTQDAEEEKPPDAFTVQNALVAKIKKEAERVERQRNYDALIARVIAQKEAEEAERLRLAAEAEAEARRKAALERVKTPSLEFSRGNSTQAGAGKAFTATFYTAYCPSGCNGVTATGYDVSNTIYTPDGLRIVAADTSVIPMYSLVQVTLADGSVFNAQVLDRGGAIKGRIIDVLVASRDEAYRLGRQNVKVHVIREGR